MTCGGRSVGIVPWRTKAAELLVIYCLRFAWYFKFYGLFALFFILLFLLVEYPFLKCVFCRLCFEISPSYALLPLFLHYMFICLFTRATISQSQ
jgi:hypothetical protein